jgi:translation initiation factor 2 beta subunit (eIF-2beta)/eIF-5
MSNFPSEDFGILPNPSAPFGNVPHDAEAFRIVQNASERTEDHKLTVRDVARMFEAAGVARTERSITNWCQPNKNGIARLNAYFDPNERKYFITARSVEIAVQEEQSKERAKGNSVAPLHDTGSKTVPKSSATTQPDPESEAERLRQKMIDLEITNRVKDQIIDRLKDERERFEEERTRYVEKLMTFNRLVGQLETRLGIEPPTHRLNVVDDGSSFRNGSEETNLGPTFSES